MRGTMRSIIELFLFFVYIGPAIADSHCFDFIRNKDETDIDCGGPTCWQRCLPGDLCTTNTDCNSVHCYQGKCSDYYRLLNTDTASGSQINTDNRTQSYVVMPYDEFNRALLVIIMMFILPCGCFIMIFLFKIYKKTERDGSFDINHPSRVELIEENRRRTPTELITESMI